MILMWSCPGNMTKYYPGLRDILPSPSVGKYVSQTWVILIGYHTVLCTIYYTSLYCIENLGFQYNTDD